MMHVEEGTAETILNPAKQDQFGSAVLCLNCHEDRQFDEWAFSSHNTAGLNCASCHSAHQAVDAGAGFAKQDVPELCYECHSDVRASFYMPSHHPVKEGKMSCLDCHAPHGGDVALVHESSGRELCFSCHGEMEGPFVYEHQPVNEDCQICHSPHGSVADNLLVENEPTLCLNCHDMHFHATVEGVDGAFTIPRDPSRNGESTPDGWKRGFLTKCTQCHTAVHGSDLPSQATSGGGTGLTR
jgi:DmsE family decaheme c-type cytochrome